MQRNLYVCWHSDSFRILRIVSSVFTLLLKIFAQDIDLRRDFRFKETFVFRQLRLTQYYELLQQLCLMLAVEENAL